MLTDLRVRTDLWEPGNYAIHEGFSLAFEQVWSPEIEPWLNDFRANHPEAPVYFTGHSLGAALATIGMARFTPGNSASYTFGCPRVGDDRFAAAVLSKGPVFRFVNGDDIVTQIPLEIVAKPYFRHVGAEKYIDRNGTIHDGFTDAQKLADVLPGITEHIREMGLAALGALGDLRDPAKFRDYIVTLLPTSLTDPPPGSPPFLVGNHSPARYPIHIWNYYSGR